MTRQIEQIDAYEVLDSRGYPTLRARVRLSGGAEGSATAPAGASTGVHEIAERRDGDPKRYQGKGVQQAAALVCLEVNRVLHGQDACRQPDIDLTLINFYGTDHPAELGANVTCAVSMAVARAAANAVGLSLYQYLGGPNARRLPVPMMNVINGGLHADNSLDFQEFMIVPHGAPNFSEALRYGAETFHALKSILRESGHSTAVGDEGGFAPNLKDNQEACGLIVDAIVRAGLEPGSDVAIALDPAASSFFENDKYVLRKSRAGDVSTDALLALYSRLVEAYPIVSVEDGFAEDDWAGFQAQMVAMGQHVQIVGDDLYTTNEARIQKGIRLSATNAVLIKINQIGTLTETINAIEACQSAGWRYIISHRSGETEDTFIADFAVAMGGGQIKTGSLSRSERLAKYNRLIEIERELCQSAIYQSPFTKD
jgi:enolase